MSSIFDKTLQGLQSAVSLRQVRHNVTSANIANAETPGYHARKVDFEDALSRALDLEGFGKSSTTHEDHMSVGGGSLSKVAPDVYENPEGAVNNDGNTVDMEKEMANLAENTIMYKAALALINKKLASIRYAATEGRS
ncbi:MAG: flagellar basal body rod protein FlgB [Pseudobdellovibrionaceae bacterium]